MHNNLNQWKLVNKFSVCAFRGIGAVSFFCFPKLPIVPLLEKKAKI